MNFNLTYLSHASFLLETEKVAILMDPWYSPQGAFLGSWRQLPPITNQVDFIKKKSKEKKIYCYVSHNHQDHFDLETLKELNDFIEKYIVVKYENRHFYDLMFDIGKEKVLEIDELTFYNIADIEIFLFKEESGINRDSAIYCRAGKNSFFNFNDCKMFDQVNIVKDKLGAIDIVTGQFSGAVMHPHSYKYANEQVTKIVDAKKRGKWLNLAKFIKEVNPKIYIPSAGPPLLIGGGLNCLNYENTNTIFPKNHEFYSWWNSKSILKKNIFYELNLFENIKSCDIKKITENKCSIIPDKEIDTYLEYYKKINIDYDTLDKDKILFFLNKEFNKKIEYLKTLDKDLLPVGKFSFIVNNSYGITVDFNNLSISDWLSDQQNNYHYSHYVSSSHISKLIESGESWEVYYLSMDFLNERAPDEYNTSLMIFLLSDNNEIMKFAYDKLRNLRDSSETIELESKHGDRVVCARFCPHAGADLMHAIFDGRYITCPRHGWKFDVKNNGLEINNNSKLEIYELDH